MYFQEIEVLGIIQFTGAKFEINFRTGSKNFRFKLNFQISKLDLRFQINSNG